jgi:hypothetical protein
MTSGDLIPTNQDRSEPAATEVQFALVIARMIESVKNSPADMRQAVYELARYKLQEQFTYADAKDIKRTQQALETAIRGVEEFSKQQVGIAAPMLPPPASEVPVASASHRQASPERVQQVRTRPHLEIHAEASDRTSKSTRAPWSHVRRTASLIAILIGLLVAVQQRERLAPWLHGLPKFERDAVLEVPPVPAQVTSAPAPPSILAKPAPVRPTDYGVYAIGNDSLTELQLLPGRAPDIRVAVSAAIKTPSQAILPNGHPKFIIFRRGIATNISDRADVRIIAKVAREFSSEVAGKKPADGDDTWVIRNVAFPFRTSPVDDEPEMVELHSEDPALELTPGRYALVLKSQSYDFTVEGEVVDSKQCIERIISTNGTFYSDCKKP